MTSGELMLNIGFNAGQSGSEEQPKKSKQKAVETPSTENIVQHKPNIKRKREKSANDAPRDPKNPRLGGKDEENQGFISRLFGKNDEVPEIEHKEVDPVQEKVFSEESFAQLENIHPFMVQNLERNFGVVTLTTVQRLSFSSLASGEDSLIRSQTGSGKTLAYAVPIVQQLQAIRPKISRAEGIQALVVLPTRELALQTYECFLKLTKSFTWLVPGLLAGGEKRKSEKARIRKGITILVCTLGRLLDHTVHTKALSLHTVKHLVLDEADKLFEMGYEKDVSQLVSIVKRQREDHFSSVNEPPKLQTILLSATLSAAVEKLAGLTLKNPSRIDAAGVDQESEEITHFVIPGSLEQRYIISQPKLKLVTLAAFIMKKCKADKGSKMIVFMATQGMVDFYTELLTTVMKKTAKFFKLHGNMDQSERTQIFKEFRSADAGILFSTDVAARGLDLPKVEWIVQFNAPATTSEYVHRVGRTARAGEHGSSLIFIAPSELAFLEELNRKRVKVDEENLPNCLRALLKLDFETSQPKKKSWDYEEAATELQLSFEQAVLQQDKLHSLASEAYKSWVRFYATYPKSSREIFNFKSLHLGHYAKSFALRDPPSQIGGLGKPHYKEMKRKRDKPRNPVSRVPKKKPRMEISEFDSGLKPLKKK